MRWTCCIVEEARVRGGRLRKRKGGGLGEASDDELHPHPDREGQLGGLEAEDRYQQRMAVYAV